MAEEKNFYKDNPDFAIWRYSEYAEEGPWYFSFDKKKIYNLFAGDYDKLTDSEKEIFDKEYPFWAEFFEQKNDDSLEYPAAAVIIIKDGKILCASRSESGELCGPGGKAEDYDTDIEATAIREAQEEFGITPLNLIPLGIVKAATSQYMDSMVYFTDEFTGTPKADGSEMVNERWLSMAELRKLPLFEPFDTSLDLLGQFCKNHLTLSKSTDTINTDNE